MTLADQLYTVNEEKLKTAQDEFLFFNSDMRFLWFKATAKAINDNDQNNFIIKIRDTFFPDDYALHLVQEKFNEATNRGISTLNELCQKHIPEIADKLRVDKISDYTNLFEMVKVAREKSIAARNGRQSYNFDFGLLREAYEMVRNIGLGYYVMLIDESPEVIASLKHYEPVRNWLTSKLGFRLAGKQETDPPYAWNTHANVLVYGSGISPFRSRPKIVDEEGKLRYGSILMKMLLKQVYPDTIDDHIAVEFIVNSEKDQTKLTDYFRNKNKITGRIEGYKTTHKIHQKNKYSAGELDFVKFTLRPPLPTEGFPPLEKNAYERVPIEVQILTLENHNKKATNPDISHEEYKKRQFASVFPLLFPRQFYESMI